MPLSDELTLNILPGMATGNQVAVIAWYFPVRTPIGVSDEEKYRLLARLCWDLDSEGLVAVPHRSGVLIAGGENPPVISRTALSFGEPERIPLGEGGNDHELELLLHRAHLKESRAIGFSRYRGAFVKGGAYVRTSSTSGLPIEVNREAYEARVLVKNAKAYLWLDLVSVVRQPLSMTISHMLERGLSEESIRKALVNRDVVAQRYSLGGVIADVRWISVAECNIEEYGQSLVDYWAISGEELDPCERPVIDVISKRTKKTLCYPPSQLNLSLRGLTFKKEERLQIPPETRMSRIRGHPILRRHFVLDQSRWRFDSSPLSVTQLCDLGLAIGCAIAPLPSLEFAEGYKSKDPRTLLQKGPAGGKRDIKVIYVAVDDAPVEELHGALSDYYNSWGFGNLHLTRIITALTDGKRSYYRAGQEAAEAISKIGMNSIVIGIIDGGTDSYRQLKKGINAELTGTFAAVQVLYKSTALDIIAGKKWIAADLLPQVYAKATQRPAWLLGSPAGGSLGNAYLAYDVSRRVSFDVDWQKGVASSVSKEASAIASLCDGYGRIITWNTYPSHTGEILGKQESWDILNAAIDKVRKTKKDAFRRLVVYKDGPIRDAERAFLTEAAKDVAEEHAREIGHAICVDIIGVPKTGIERIFRKRDGSFSNPERGTYVLLPGNTALLVASAPRYGTADPIHINYLESVGGDRTPMETVVQEFFDLTNLDWRSLYQQPKSPLPLQLVQSLGELLTLDIGSPPYIPL